MRITTLRQLSALVGRPIRHRASEKDPWMFGLVANKHQVSLTDGSTGCPIHCQVGAGPATMTVITNKELKQGYIVEQIGEREVVGMRFYH